MEGAYSVEISGLTPDFEYGEIRHRFDGENGLSGAAKFPAGAVDISRKIASFEGRAEVGSGCDLIPTSVNTNPKSGHSGWAEVAVGPPIFLGKSMGWRDAPTEAVSY